MNTTNLRRHNLRQWITQHHNGQQTKFAQAIAINQGELSALLKNKSFGEKKARKIEQAANMPDMWLVKTTKTATPPPSAKKEIPCPTSPPSPKS
jgi:3,4-dihydroxy-2-butanone-4-phosphate synthase